MGIATRMRSLGTVGKYKYNNCTTIDQIKKINSEYKNDLLLGEWNYKLDKLTAANGMFGSLATIKKFNVNLPVCTNVNAMFKGSSNFYEFNGQIPKVNTASNFFDTTRVKYENEEIEFPEVKTMLYGYSNCIRIEKSSVKFPKLESANGLFLRCYRMESFNGELSALKDGNEVFRYNYNFSNFEADLPKLSNAPEMFASCILNKESVIRIANTLPTYTSGTHNITIGIQKSLETNEEVLAAIATIKSKGWTVTTQWNTGYNGLEVLSNDLNEKMELGIELPEGYTRLYYLEDLGRQWINTGYIPTVNTGLYVIAKQIVSSAGWPIGLATHTDGATYGIAAPLWARTSSVLSMYYIYNTAGYQDTLGRGEAYEGWTNFLNDKVAKVDVRGTIYSRNLTKYTKTYTHPLWISKTNAPNNTSTNTRAFNGRIYRVKISEGTEIVRDYVPALDPNGKPCMYELMEGKPYYNQGEYEDFDYDFPPTNSN